MKYKINPNIRTRFESRIKNGTFFIYNIENQDILISDVIGKIIFDMLKIYDDKSYIENKIKETFKQEITSDEISLFFNKLISRNFIIEE